MGEVSSLRSKIAGSAILPTPGEWFTAAELADLRLPGLPGDKRSINRRAQDERWHSRVGNIGGDDGAVLVRERRGRGGGVEFHISLLPGDARLEMARRGIGSTEAPQEAPRTEEFGWAWLEKQPEKTRQTAERRLSIINEIDVLVEAGVTKGAAVAQIAKAHTMGMATLWGWLKLVDGIARADRLPALAPRHRGGGKKADIDPYLWNLFKSDWLRPECPTLTSCYDRTAAKAKEMGLAMPSDRAIRRKIEREIDPRVIVLARGGREKAERAIPDNRRTLDSLHAMDLVNIDGHQFDVFVTPPDGGKPVRPVMIAIQDVYSRKMLAWRMDLSENFLATRLAFADLFERYGIPNQCLLDNSRTFAGKGLTGGAKTRYRNKIKEEEAAGLLVSLGIRIRFAKVYHGQSKPIERAFRDLADRVARAPACAGAYTGNSVANKPANYGKRAVPWAEFEEIVAQGIAEHNAREGRRTETARGRSFDVTFAESYESSQIRKAAPEQLRMALLAAEQKRINRRSGEIDLYGNRYWSPDCGLYLGEMVTVRFDPEDLHREVHVYAASDGRYLARAELIQDFGFTDAAGAVAQGKRRKEAMAQIRAGLAAERLMAAADVAAEQVRNVEPELPVANVIRPVRTQRRGGAQAALKVQVEAVPRVKTEAEATVMSALHLVVGGRE